MNQALTKALQQLTETWKHLGLNQRVSVVLALGAVVAGLVGVGFWASRPDYALLYGKLDDAEAAKVIAALDELKVPYTTAPGGAILVPPDQVHRLRMQLAGRGIPRGDGVGFEIFDKPNFGISDFVQRANYLRAVQGELSRTISQLDEVETARVMIVMPENRLLVDEQKKPTASVFVRTRGNAQLSPSAVNSIRFLVANSVEGLKASAVSVVDHMGNVLSGHAEEGSAAGLSSTQLASRRELEQYLARKAEGMLERVLGPGQAVVRVAAEINWDTITRVEERFDPDGQVLRTSTVDDELTTTTSTDANGGAAGVASNNGETNGPAGSPSSTSQTKKKNTSNQYEINKSTSNILQAAGGLKRVSAAVFIAARFEGEGKDRKAVPRPPEELKKLQRIVQSALGIIEGDPARKDEVTLEEIPFNDQPALDLAKQLETDSRRQFYWEIGRTALWVGLALTVLFIFFRLLKRTPLNDMPLGLPVPDLGGEGAPAGLGRDAKPGIVTAEVLNQLIRENPANMTQAVRAWMTKGKASN
ncbi:MAG TPA: flagellar basal-body MS-ring/collar protein FliF [Methylomirabilota bacterium]|nr:flagellar basal-body MS-ring/collar protein FliF [Methylomirabilota bacterium]